MKFYKYYDDEKFKVIFNESGVSIRFSQISALNDPFEARINFISHLENHDKNLEKEILSFNPSQKELDRIRHETKSRRDHFSQKKEIELDKAINKSIGIFCLSSNPLNKLMWSHYTNSYKGFCIEFDFKNHVECSLPNRIFPVNYTNKRVLYSEKFLAGDKDHMQSITELLTSKDNIWSYENEYRAIANISKIKKNREYEIPIVTSNIKYSFISKIFFGINSKEEDIDYVKNLINQKQTNHIKLSKVSLCPKNYELIEIPIE